MKLLEMCNTISMHPGLRSSFAVQFEKDALMHIPRLPYEMVRTCTGVDASFVERCNYYFADSGVDVRVVEM